MNRPLSIALTAIIILAQTAALHAQSSEPDILYINDGSEVKGAIIELIPDKTVKIRTSDSCIYVYQMANVKKISMNPKSAAAVKEPATAAPDGQESQLSVPRREFNAYIFAGLSVPRGDFGADLGETGGAAQTGYVFGADAEVTKGAPLAWLSSVDISVNSANMGPSYSGTGIFAKADSWTNTWLLTGLKLFSSKTHAFVFGQLGLLIGRTPEITLTSGDARATQHSASATALGYGFGAGMKMKRFVLSLRYLGGKPKYEISASNGAMSVTTTYEQPTSCVLIMAGFEL
jgi:hypothetical protein